MGGRLDGRVAIVTGAGSGLGKASAERFAAEGAAVLCADIDGGAATATAEAIAAAGGRAEATTTDVTSQDATEAMAARALEAFGGRIDVLFANAGIEGEGKAGDTTLEAWQRVLAVDLTGVWLSARAVLPTMVTQHGGSIVCTASVAGLSGVPGIASYTAAKGGVVALVRQMAVDYAADGIRVNAICPGTVPTPLVMRAYEARTSAGQPAAHPADVAPKRYPMQRLGTVEDVANLALFLASDESGWMTGVAVPVDGGLSTAAWLAGN